MDELKEQRGTEEQIRALMRRLLTVQEDERRRISRDLHDQLGQQVVALGLKLDALAGATDLAQVRQGIEAARQTLASLDRDLDFFTWELRPAALDDLGLVVALGNFTSKWSTEFNIPTEFQSRGLESTRLSFDIETNLYRIAQEALNNVYKHAAATRAGVILERRNQQVVLIIEDDGRGFDALDKATPEDVHAIGLLGMQERASFIGGSLEIETSPGRGTTIFVQVPLNLH